MSLLIFAVAFVGTLALIFFYGVWADGKPLPSRKLSPAALRLRRTLGMDFLEASLAWAVCLVFSGLRFFARR